MERPEDFHTLLYKQDPDQKIPQRMAVISPLIKYTEDEPEPYWTGRWRARIIASKQQKFFSSVQQAKDWAQAVILLTQ
jgi:hypothetical protein